MMQNQLSMKTQKPQLFINTQFSSEEESQTYGHFQFQPKDVISEADSFDLEPKEQQQKTTTNQNIIRQEKFDMLVTGIIQLSYMVDSRKVNSMIDAFQTLKNIKPKKLNSLEYGRTTSKELRHTNSITNLRNQNHIVHRLHQRKKTNSSQKDLERAQVLNQIIAKLHSRQRSNSGKSQNKSQVKNQNNTHSHRSMQKKQIVKQKLKNLEHMLKDYKLTNEQSNQKSTVYYTKHYNKSKRPNNNFTLQNSGMQNSENNTSLKGTKVSTFKKLKNDIMQVKTQFDQLKHMNQIYRKQNSILRNQRASENSRLHRNNNPSPDKNIAANFQTQSWQNVNVFPQPQTNQSHYVQNYAPYGYHYAAPIYSAYPQTYPQTYPNYGMVNSSKQHVDFNQGNHLKSDNNKCSDARHQNYWKTMIPENPHINLIESRIRGQPIVFCFKCGCKCAEEEDRLNITEKKGFLGSPMARLRDFL